MCNIKVSNVVINDLNLKSHNIVNMPAPMFDLWQVE